MSQNAPRAARQEPNTDLGQLVQSGDGATGSEAHFTAGSGGARDIPEAMRAFQAMVVWEHRPHWPLTLSSPPPIPHVVKEGSDSASDLSRPSSGLLIPRGAARNGNRDGGWMVGGQGGPDLGVG